MGHRFVNGPRQARSTLVDPGRIQALVDALADRILVLDGAMGTMIQAARLGEDDYRGKAFADHPSALIGANDLLSITRPDLIREIHEAYFAAGADLVETNTFNAQSVSLADYGLEDQVHAVNFAAARAAREAADAWTARTPDRPRWAVGILGPTNRTASLSPDVDDPGARTITFAELAEAYLEQARGLVDGGVDALMVETVFDTLNAKAALWALSHLLDEVGIPIPVLVSGTITDRSGRTLTGQTPEAFWNSIRHGVAAAFPRGIPPWAERTGGDAHRPARTRSGPAPEVGLLSVGLNCALGPEQLRPHLEEMSRVAECFVSVHPNAGLPNAFGGYDKTPDAMAEASLDYAESGFVNIVGGCCGTTPEHIQAMAEAVAGLAPRRIPRLRPAMRLSGLQPVSIGDDALLVNVGERTNVTGSRRFRRLISEGDYTTALEVARDQVTGGAQVVDVNMDEGLLDSVEAMRTFLNLVAAEPDIAAVPLMIDSSRWDVLEAGLRCVQGKAIVNSISLKEGEEDFRRQAREVRRFGAAVVVMAFDEDGQADTVERRVAIARRAYRILVDELGFPAEDIVFDPNVFAVATGIAEHDRYAIDFIEATRRIKGEFPHMRVSGGVSNLSFSFRGSPEVREAMHASFLYHAVQAGLDMAIVNAGALQVYDEVSPPLLEAVEDVLFMRRPDATERLTAIAERRQGRETARVEDLAWRELPVGERLKHALVKGFDQWVEDDVEEARVEFGKALDVIEGPLMDGMNRVGDLFGDGRMFLPQVVRSARVMKRGVARLLPYLEAEESGPRTSAGRVLMATVKGDVHDIGKNIVGVVLQCNGYEVVDLGVMVPTDVIVEKATDDIDIVGLSGLITPSLDHMVHVAREMERAGLDLPLLIGGATTSRTHTAVKIEPEYNGGPTVHVHDASRAVGVVGRLLDPKGREEYHASLRDEYERLRARHLERRQRAPLVPLSEARARGAPVDPTRTPPPPAHPGRHLFDPIPVDRLRPLIDWSPFLGAWELSGPWPTILDDEAKGEQARTLIDDANRLLDRIEDEGLLTVRGVAALFPADRTGADDITVWEDATRARPRATLHFLRQQFGRKEGRPHRSLADLILEPREGAATDWMGAFAVSAGSGLDAIAAYHEARHDDYAVILAQAVADRLAEAAAEWLHYRVRTDLWGYARDEPLDAEALTAERFLGIRPAPGYPACPDHSQKHDLFALLAAGEIGLSLTESCAMVPTAAVAGWYFAHPDAAYFGVGRVGRDQAEDYARRKGWPLAEAERWLAPNLGYDPDGDS